MSLSVSADVQQQWFRAWVEQCLRVAWSVQDLVLDEDGDYPFRQGLAACWVRVERGNPPLVRVFAHAAASVKRSAKLLAELNDVNTRSRLATVCWQAGPAGAAGGGGLVMVDHALHAESVTAASLAHACAAVGTLADSIGLLVASLYGGATPFPALDEPPLAEPQDR